MIAVGLMSGTSLDGIDAALVRIEPQAVGYRLELLRFETIPFEAGVLQSLRATLPPNDGSVAVVAALHHALGLAFGAAARQVAGATPIAYVASHGLTLWHDGPRNVTLQLGDPFALREATGATVCYDFRSGDCAAGGHGAPLVPYFDALLFANAGEDRIAVNLGGIANITVLPRAGEVVAYDTGPGNMLLDGFVRERTRGTATFDRDGSFASAGTVDDDVLAALLAEDYFAAPPPKSTGRERFGAQFLLRHREKLARLSLEDGAATLTELTAATVAGAVAAAGFAAGRAIVSGGGARNPALLARLAARLAPIRVDISDALGVPVDAKEAMAFAMLGYETLRGRASNVPGATGARRAVPLGAIAPLHLRALLEEVERECRMPS
jgi:anhydro-N-acetylmuramic acid kinase